MNTSVTIGLLKEAIGIVMNFNLPRRVVDSLATAESYMEGDKSDVLYALGKLEDAVNSISTSKFNSNLYILGVQREDRRIDYNCLCLKISEIHKKLGHHDPALRWIERQIPIQEMWDMEKLEEAREAAGGFDDTVVTY